VLCCTSASQYCWFGDNKGIWVRPCLSCPENRCRLLVLDFLQAERPNGLKCIKQHVCINAYCRRQNLLLPVLLPVSIAFGAGTETLCRAGRVEEVEARMSSCRLKPGFIVPYGYTTVTSCNY